MARAQGARTQMAAAFKTTYGTPPAAGNYWKMPFATSGLGSEQPLLSSELLGYGRDPLAPIKDAITADGDVVVPVDARFLGVWLKALFGAPTTTGTTGAYIHEFRSGGWSLPSLAIEIGNPEVPSYRMTVGCAANSLALSMTRAGLITATVNLIAQGEATSTASATGLLEDLDLTRFGAFQGQVKREGTVLGNLVSADLTYSNNLDRIEVIRADGKIDGVDPGGAALTGNLVTRFASSLLLDQAVSGAPCELEFSYGTGAVSLTITAHAVYLPKPKLPITGPAGIQASFAWQAAQGANGRMVTVRLANDIANYNNPT